MFKKYEMGFILIPTITNKTIHSWAKKSIKKTILSNIIYFRGISLNIESSYGNPMLNVVRPAVLRQYYGLNFDDSPYNGTVKKYTYGFCSAKISGGRNLTNFVTKPFHMHLKHIVEYITILCSSYKHELGLCKITFKQQFNYCVKLLQYLYPMLKT